MYKKLFGLLLTDRGLDFAKLEEKHPMKHLSFSMVKNL